MAKVLKAHTDLLDFITAGKEYEVVDEEYWAYEIIDDRDKAHMFTKEPDEGGHSYATWFELKEEK